MQYTYYSSFIGSSFKEQLCNDNSVSRSSYVSDYLSRNEANFDNISHLKQKLDDDETILIFDLEEMFYNGPYNELFAMHALYLFQDYLKKMIQNRRTRLRMDDLKTPENFSIKIQEEYRKWDQGHKFGKDIQDLIFQKPFWHHFKKSQFSLLLNPENQLLKKLWYLKRSIDKKYRLVLSTNLSEQFTRGILKVLKIQNLFHTVFFWNNTQDPKKIFLKTSEMSVSMIEQYFDIKRVIDPSRIQFNIQNEEIVLFRIPKRRIFFFDASEKNVKKLCAQQWYGFHVSSITDLPHMIENALCYSDAVQEIF